MKEIEHLGYEIEKLKSKSKTLTKRINDLKVNLGNTEDDKERKVLGKILKQIYSFRFCFV